MVIQTMGSQGIGVGAGVGVGDSSATKPPHLSRKSSLYSLTLDEFQNHLGNVGKPLSSMNLDELLRNVWTLEANQSLGSVINVENGAPNSLEGALSSSLVRQSSFSLSRDLSRKTVGEVWREIQRCKESDNGRNNLGEMTLEDFLVKAGVSVDGAGNPIRVTGLSSVGPADLNTGIQSSVSEHPQWMQYQPQQQQQQQQQQQHGMMPVFMQQGCHISGNVSVSGGVVPDLVYGDAQLGSPLIGAVSDTQTGSRKRVAHGVVVVEKIVERKQKRMIKNRESAARSRARKQAYTNELENKVSRLEEENERLRRMRKVEKALPSAPPPQPKHQLRRTSSAPF